MLGHSLKQVKEMLRSTGRAQKAELKQFCKEEWDKISPQQTHCQLAMTGA